MFLGPTARRELVQRDKHWLAKSRFRALSTLLALFAICCLGISAQYYNSESTRDPTVAWADEGADISVPNYYALGLLSWSVIWNSSNYLVNYTKHRPANPGASVSMELLTWLFLAASASYMLTDAVPFYNKWGVAADLSHKLWEYAGIFLTLIVCVLHFILFVYACQHCHVWRRSRMTVEKIELENVTRIEVTPKRESPSPVVIACVHCQREFSNHGHEDFELVAGAPTDGPPHYSAAAEELSSAKQV